MQAVGRCTRVEQSSGTAPALKEAGELEEAQHEDTVELLPDLPVKQTMLCQVTGSSSSSILINDAEVARGPVSDAADISHCLLGSVRVL